MDLSALHKAIVYLIVGGGALKIIALGTLYYVVSGLGVRVYGEYTLAVAIISLMGVGYRMVLGQIYQIELAQLLGNRHFSAAKRFRIQALLIITCVTVLLGGVIVAGVFFLRLTDIVDIDLSEYVFCIAIGTLNLFSIGYKNLSVTTNRGYGYFKEQSQWDVAEALWRFVLVCLFVTFFSAQLTLPQMLFIDWIAIVVGWGTYLLFFHKKYTYSPPVDDEINISLLSLIRQHGIWFFLRLLAVDLTANMRLWIIGAMLSVEAVGIFGAAKRIVQSGKVLLPFGVVLDSFLPKNSLDTRVLRSSYIMGLRASIMLTFAVIILLLLVTFAIVPFAFPDMGIELQLVILIFSGIYLFKAGSYSVGSMLGVDRRYKAAFYSVSISLVTMLVFLPLLIYFLGLYGVAIEGVVSTATAFSIAYYLLVKERPDFAIKRSDLKGVISLRHLLELKHLLKG